MPISEKQLRQRYMQTFGAVSGAIVLKDLQNRCHKRDTTYVPGNESWTFVNEGKRQVLLTIENMMSAEGIAKLDESPEKESEL